MNTALPCEGCGCAPCRWAIPCDSQARRRDVSELHNALRAGPFVEPRVVAAAVSAFDNYTRAADLLRQAFDAGRDSVTGHMGLCDFAEYGGADGGEEADEVVRKLLGDPPPG